jgi:transcriptional regulator GlxA family with amidase domain
MPDSSKLGCIGFSGLAADALLDFTGLPGVEPQPTDRFDKLWQRFKSLWQLGEDQRKRHHAGREASEQLYVLLDVAEGVRDERSGARLHSPNDETSQQAFATAVNLIHAHYREDLRLQNVAEALGYTVQHLNRLFHRAYGMTGHQYMQHIRLERAASWLDDHPWGNVRQAAETVGMDTNHFIRMYKRQYGTTPGLQTRQKRQGQS